MVKAYLRYEQAAGFGVVACSTAAVVPIPNEAGQPLIAAPGVDALLVWNVRKGETIASIGNRSTRKAGSITAIAVSEDGETLAAGYSDGSIRLWHFNPTAVSRPNAFDEEEPEPLISFNGHRSGVSCLAFATGLPDATNEISQASAIPTRLVSGSNDGDLIVWNTAEEVGKFRIAAHNDAITSAIFLTRKNTSYILSSSKDGLIRIYDVETQHCVQTIVGHRAEVWAMQLDVTNSLLITGSIDSEIRAYVILNNIAEYEPEGSNPISENSARDLGFDRDSIFKPIGSVLRYKAAERVTSIALTNRCGESFLVVTGADTSAELFRVRSVKDAYMHLRRRKKRMEKALGTEIRGKGEDEGLETDEIERQVKEQVSKIETRLDAKDFLTSARQLRFATKLRSICFLLTSAQVPISKSKAGIELQMLVQTKANALEVHMANIVGKSKKRKRTLREAGDTIDDGDKGKVEKLVTLDFAGHRADIRSVSLSADDRTLLATSRSALKLWNIASQRCVRTMKLDGYGLSTALLGADASRGVVGLKEGTLSVYDLGSGSLVTNEETAHEGAIWDMCLDDHIYEANTLITCGADKRICFWNIEDVLVGISGKLKQTRTLEMADEVLCVRVAYTRERPVLVASLLDTTVRAYYMDTLEPYLNFYGHRLPVMSMDISSDGLMLATGSADKSIKLWGMDFGDCRRSLRAHSDSVMAIAFQSKTHYLFSGSRDGSVKYWDGDKFEFISELDGHNGEVRALTLSDDGEIVVSASQDRMIRVWRRTDEPMFLEEEKDRRMDEMFESTLIDDDLKEASKVRKNTGFMEDASKGEATGAGKRSLDTIKGGERLLEALELCEEETVRQAGETDEGPNPLLLGLSPDAYMLKTLEQIKTPDLEEALHILPLDAAVRVMQYCCRLLDSTNKLTRLSGEMLCRVGLYLIKLHHSQITAGAASRKLIFELQERMKHHVSKVREMMGFNTAALHFWGVELAERDDAPFRDASARAFNIQYEKSKKMKKAKSVRSVKV